MKTTIAAFALVAAAGSAAANLQITEVYTGISGQDGTADWFELTNFGASAVSTAGLFYDDSAPNGANADPLSTLTVGAGESVIFLLTDLTNFNADASEQDSLAAFQAIWGGQFNTTNVGWVDGSGLGQSGDEVNLFTDTGDIPGSLVDNFTYGSAGTNLTFDIATQGGGLSVLGEGGAYQSNLFFNDDIGDDVFLVGSPGAIPAPGAAAVLGVAGLAAVRRRRA